MNTLKNYFIAFVSMAFLLGSTCACVETCEIACTDEYRMITVKLNNGTLTSFYTVRTSTNDTIRHEQNPVFGELNIFPVLTDSYHNKLVNSSDWFVFHGFYNGEEIIKEHYLIRGDACHINLLIGKTEFN
jgi:hypothetical protein